MNKEPLKRSSLSHDKPLVSIVIPCYNSELWLEETLESALGQSWPQKEIIVVDDGSTDNSLSIARSFESRGVKVISQENRGGCVARNRGLKEARGDFIQFLDADDLLAPDKIERQLEMLAGRQDCAVTGKWGRFQNSIDELTISVEPIWVDLVGIDWVISVLQGKGMMAVHGWLTPRNIIEQVGPWNEELHVNQDGEYFCRVALACRQVLFCPDALCYYRSNLSGSVSRVVSRKKWESIFLACDLCVQHLLNVEDSPRTRQACANAYQRFVYKAYPLVPALVKRAEERIYALGGADVKSSGPPLYETLTRFMPWKLARRLHRTLRPHSYPPQEK